MGRVQESTAKRLFALSGNACAFPKCAVRLVDIPTGKVTGRICHIKARRPEGPRYDPFQSDYERDSFDNLILLCSLHHDVIDADEESYTVERLKRMKAEHESVSAGNPEDLPDEFAHAFVNLSATAAGSISTSRQSGGQVAHFITNNYTSPSTEQGAADPRVIHDTRVFRQAEELFDEEMADSFFSNLMSGHEYYSSESRALAQFVNYLQKISNDFIDSELEELSDQLIAALHDLHAFIAMKFWIWPEDQQRENFRYCMYPWGNMDRGWDGNLESERRYDQYERELGELVHRASSALAAFRRAVKTKLFI